MQTVVFLDLDDTLFQTLPKCPPGDEATPVAYHRDGRPLSYMTRKQRAFLDFLQAGARVIPTTARNLDAYRRVRLDFTDHAILDFGGVILRPDGSLDPAWDAKVRPQTRLLEADVRQLLTDVLAFIARHQLGVSARLIVDFDMPLYLVLKHPQADVAELETIRREHWGDWNDDRFFLHFNGNNLSLTPRFLCKEHAMKYLVDTTFPEGPPLVLGVGDSVSDGPFLARADFAVVPRASQIACRLFGDRRPT